MTETAFFVLLAAAAWIFALACLRVLVAGRELDDLEGLAELEAFRVFCDTVGADLVAHAGLIAELEVHRFSRSEAVRYVFDAIRNAARTCGAYQVGPGYQRHPCRLYQDHPGDHRNEQPYPELDWFENPSRPGPGLSVWLAQDLEAEVLAPLFPDGPPKHWAGASPVPPAVPDGLDWTSGAMRRSGAQKARR